MTTSTDYFKEGMLSEAISELGSELSSKPNDMIKRAFLAELLCISGDLERADAQLDVLVTLEPDKALTIGTWRQLIRAATTRREVYDNGRTPDVVDDPTNRIKSLLATHISMREGDQTAVAQQTLELENNREPCAAVVNGNVVDDIRDLDDLSAGILEVMATNGMYYWVDFTQICSLEFEAPQRPLDLLWRKASIILHKGTEGEVFIPSIYATPTDDNEALLARKTEWLESSGLVRGVGQRNYLAGDEVISLMDIENIEFMSSPVAMTG